MKIFFVILAFLLPNISNSQNLVANGSFEDTSITITTGLPSTPAGWLFIRRAYTNGYAHLLDGIPAYEGKRKLAFTVGNRHEDKRTYWETVLLKELEKSITYKLTMHIHGWDDPPNLNDLGIWLIDSLFFVDSDTLLQPKIYIDILHAKVKPEKNGWFRIEEEFVPDRNVRNIMVGNFSSKDYQKVAEGRFSRSFYVADFIDDIRIEPVVKRPCQDCPRIKDSLYLASATLFSQQRSERYHEATVKTVVDTVLKAIDTLELPSLLFAFNSSTISDSNSLMQYKTSIQDPRIRKIVIAGYTDSVGTKEYNTELAEKRAMAIAGQLESRFGVKSSIVEAIGKGVSHKYSEAEKNRRVEIYIYRY